MRMRLSSLVLPTLALVASSVTSQEPPSSPEFQINFFTTGSHVDPAVARDDSGNFVAVWQFGSQVLLRGFDAQASPLFEGVAETLPDTFQGRPGIAMAATGAFVVAWDHEAVYAADGVRARRFDAAGAPIGPGFMVSNTAGGYQESASLSMRPGGGFIVSWQGGSLGVDTSESSVQAELFDAAGNSEGPNFLVNTTTTSWQYLPSVAASEDGQMLVVWTSATSSGTDTDASSVQGRLLDPVGVPTAPDFQINTYTTGRQGYATVAAAAGGGFVVVWSGEGEGDTSGVFGRRLDSDADPVGGEFQVNSYTTSQQLYAVVAGSSNGFLVTWESYGSPGNDRDSVILARSFGPAADPRSDDFQVNTWTPYYQRYPSVAATPSGDFIVVWQSTGSVDGDTGQSVAGRLYFGAIFEDGFESGDTSAWSSTVE